MGDVVVDETPPLPRLSESPIQGVAVQQSDPDPALPVVPLRRSQRGWHPSEAALQHIAAAGPASGRVAMLGDWDVSDVLGREDEDMVFTTDWARSSFKVDLLHATQEQDVPRSFAQVMKLSPEARIPWIEACRAQCRSFLAIPAISGVLRPDQWTKAPPIRLSWVLTTKPPLDEPKARIVMLGQHMREGVHFNDTHAPVASVTCVRVLLAITAAAGRLLTQFDVKAAFLTAPLDIELDVILPDGFGIGSDDGQFSSPEGRRRRALTAIPGCPQGSRVWREKLVQVLASLGFKPFLPDEPCLLDSGSDPIYLLTYP